MTQWIDNPEALRQHLAAWQGQPHVALDTEFVRERTYYPQLALVQLAIPGDVLLVDPLAEGMAEALRPLLADTSVLKLMHSASEDLQALLRGCNALPEPLFDTQVAAALCGLGAGLGYQKLVEQITGVTLEKGETRSDWLRRPLSESQLHYAADDVRYLHPVYAELEARLAALGRREWAMQDAERALRNAGDDNDDPWPHLSLRSAQGLDAQAQARLCRLLRWRDVQARKSDLPRGWVLDNELAATLSRRVPRDLGEFNALLARHPKAPRKHKGQLWEILTEPLREDERQIPLLRVPEPRDKAKLRELQQAVADLASELQIPEGLLCARRHLEALMDGRDWPEALAGWRRERLEPVLKPLLAAD